MTTRKEIVYVQLLKIGQDSDRLSETEFNKILREKVYKGMKILSVNYLGVDEQRRWLHKYELILGEPGKGQYICITSNNVKLEQIEKADAVVILNEPSQNVFLKKFIAKKYNKKIMKEEELDECKEML